MLKKLSLSGSRYWLVAALAALMMATAYWTVSPSAPTETCYEKAAQETDQNGPLTDFWNWITKDSISFFTCVLALVSGTQGFLIWRQIRLARDEFVATHRPRLFVQRVSITHGRDDREFQIPARGVVHVANGGETDLRITEWEGAIYYHGDNAMFIPRGGKITVYDLKDARTLSPGQPGILEFEQPADDLGKSEFDGGNALLFVIGRLTYEGDDGISRVTGFCRLYNRNTGRWAIDKPGEYEYAY